MDVSNAKEDIMVIRLIFKHLNVQLHVPKEHIEINQEVHGLKIVLLAQQEPLGKKRVLKRKSVLDHVQI